MICFHEKVTNVRKKTHPFVKKCINWLTKEYQTGFSVLSVENLVTTFWFKNAKWRVYCLKLFTFSPLEWFVIYMHSKSPFLQVTVNFELKWIIISSRHSNSILLAILLSIEHSSGWKLRVYLITHTKENLFSTINTFRKISKAVKSNEWAKLKSGGLLPIVYLLELKKKDRQKKEE